MSEGEVKIRSSKEDKGRSVEWRRGVKSGEKKCGEKHL